MQAGPEKLKNFGWILTIDGLANHDVTRWDEVLNLSYDRVILKLVMNRERLEYEKRYKEIIESKNNG